MISVTWYLNTMTMTFQHEASPHAIYFLSVPFSEEAVLIPVARVLCMCFIQRVNAVLNHSSVQNFCRHMKSYLHIKLLCEHAILQKSGISVSKIGLKAPLGIILETIIIQIYRY